MYKMAVYFGMGIGLAGLVFLLAGILMIIYRDADNVNTTAMLIFGVLFVIIGSLSVGSRFMVKK